MPIDSQVFEELLDKSANGVLMVSADGIIQYANAYTYQMFAYEKPALIGCSVDILVPFEYRQNHGQHVRQFFSENKSRDMGKGNHFPAIKANGEKFFISVHLKPSDDNDHMVVTVTETTKHKIKEGSLEAHSAHLQMLNDQLVQFTKETTNALLTTDEDFRISWTNPAFEKLTGFKNTEVQLERPLLLVGRNTSLFELRKMQNAVDSQTQYSGEMLFYKKNKVPFWSMINVQPYHADRSLKGFLILFTDITEQKSLERKLIDSNNLQKALLNSAPILLMSSDSKGVISTFNQYASELLDCNQINVIGHRTPLAFLSEVSRADLCFTLSLEPNANDSLVINTLIEFCNEQPLQLEVEFISFVNQSYIVELNISVIESRSIDTLGLLWLGRDISAQRLAEEENQRSTKLLETTGKMAQLGGWELELSSNSLYWADEVYRIHEIPIGSEVKVEDAINFYAPEARQVISKAIEKAIAAGEAWDEQLPFITAKGQHIWVRAVGYAEYESGAPVRLRGAFQNITQLKNTEQEAIAANAAKSDFLANISHEIRTPLNGLLGLNELLTKTPLTSQQSEYVGMIAHSGHNLLRIVNDILDFSKVEAGKMVLQPTPCNVLSLVNQLVDTFATQHTDNEALKWSLDCDDDLSTPIILDQGRLQQILNNLLSNAGKFTETGKISVKARRKQNNQLMFEVIDTGIGIPVAKQQSLFEKFTQVDMSATRQQGGTGLGLAICYQLVDLMGGEIGVKSEINHGSVFWFKIPYQAMAAEDLQDKPAQPGVKQTNQVLVVCGDPELQHTWFEATLSNDAHQFQVKTVDTAPQALQSMKLECPDIVVIYSNLTGMSGVEFAKFLRNQKEYSGIKLIGIDESESANAGALYQDIGFDGFFERSASILEVIEGAEQICSRPNEVLPRQVLLVEDNEINQIVAKDMLESLGCKVSVANNGQIAVDMIEQQADKFDIIFMDCQMPTLDGYEATRKIRQLPDDTAQSIPIIALTANVMASDKQLCTDAGMNAHVGKPVKIDAFKAILSEW